MSRFLAGIGLAALSLAVLCPTDVGAQSTELVYANGYARTTISTGILADEWIERIEKATEGRVKVRHVPGGALVKPERMLEGVRGGVADLGSAVVAFFPGQLPIISTLAGMVDLNDGNKLDMKATPAIIMKLQEEFKEIDDEFKNLGVSAKFWIASAPFAVIATKPLRKLDDLQGMKIRTFGSNMPRIYAAVGAVPVSMAFGEVYTSLQTGVIDGALTDPPAMITNRLYEVAKHMMTTGPAGGALTAAPAVLFIFNNNSWAKLAKRDQDLIEKVSREFTPIAGQRVIETQNESLDGLKKNGVRITHLSEEETRELTRKSPDFYAFAEQAINAKGLPGTALIKRYRELAADYISGKWKPWN